MTEALLIIFYPVIAILVLALLFFIGVAIVYLNLFVLGCIVFAIDRVMGGE